MDCHLSILLIFTTQFVGDVTSQEHPVLSSAAGSGVQEVIVPMCRGLVPYTHTKLPNSFNHSTQLQVHRIIEHMWAIMDSGCSKNFRLFICSLYLPPYDSVTDTTSKPCKETCMRARRKCKQAMKDGGQSRRPELRCRHFKSSRRDNTCVRAYPEPRRNNRLTYTYCQANPLPVCNGLPAALENGSLPNRFLQWNSSEIEIEMQYYTTMLSSGCSAKLPFFLCGTYMPFCLPNNAFATPCREVCEEVQASCQQVHDNGYQGLPWPNKLQCHRFYPEGEGLCAKYDDFFNSVNHAE